MLESLFIERMDENEEIFGRLMNDDDFRRVAGEHLLHEVYERLQSDRYEKSEPVSRGSA
jgi:type I restriction enzyme R subunit